MDTIKDTLINLIRDLKTKKPQTKEDHAILLKKTLTQKELRHIKLNYLKQGILNVNVDSSSWLYSLSLRKQDLLTKINKKCSAIKDIHFRIGAIK
jgi:predicted nucleic acid-binding Zn ribbon protein